MESSHSVRLNEATRSIVSTLGVLVGIGSIDHGLLECLQGSRPTPGLIVNALGAGYRWTVWKQGGEGAFTLIPNFLITGIVATLLGLLVIVWSIRSMQTAHGPAVFLCLGVTSSLTGGGVAQILLLTLTWAVGTRIRASLAFWRWLIPRSICPVFGRVWPWTLGTSTVLFAIALEIAIFGNVPGVSEQTGILHVCWKILAIVLALFLVSILSGFAGYIEAASSEEKLQHSA
jgi:ABC-type Na+ efflux pump permease subunit